MATPPNVRSLILSQQEEIRLLRQENEQMRQQLTALAAELVSLRERIGRIRVTRPNHPPATAGASKRPFREKAVRAPMIICLKPVAAAAPHGRRGGLRVLMTPMLTVFSQALSRSRAAAMELLGPSLGGNRASAERSGASAVVPNGAHLPAPASTPTSAVDFPGS
jgi:hypothetical protein